MPDNDSKKHRSKSLLNVGVIQNVESISESGKATGIKIDASGVQNLTIGLEPDKKSDPLKHLSALSQIAVREAEYIVRDDFSGLDDTVSLNSGLYVTRTIEKEQKVADWIEKSVATDHTPILISGDAGNGKTTLLWHIYRELEVSDGFRPFFVKSSWLLPGSDFDAEILIAGLADMDESGGQPVVLLDTVDLLMHTERDMYELLKLIPELRDIGVVAVMTCRPRETAILRHHLKPDYKYLGGYDDGELEDAIGKHVARFYAYADTRERFEHVRRISDAVARGMPVRDVCKNPLTLRMLFVLYAPEEVPEEIHAFRLYEEYWRKRVETDQRAGAGTTAGKKAADLSESARTAALVMLAEGSPEIDGRLLLNALRRTGRSDDDIDLLVNRGVLLRSLHGVSFFHQTFFEYGAASALLRVRGPESVNVLWNRIRKNPNDLFIIPVYEHLLLQAGSGTLRLRKTAHHALKSLFEEGNLFAAISGVYVYCHLRTIPSDIQTDFRRFIENASSEIVNQYLKFAHNTDRSRVGQLFENLDLIWENGDFKKRKYAVDILERFSLRRDTARYVMDFIRKHALPDYGLSTYPQTDEIRRIARLIAGLSRHDSEFSWNVLMELYIKSLEKTHKRDFNQFVISLVARDADVYGIDAASRLEKELIRAKDEYKGVQEETSRFYGKLWLYEWTNTKKPTESILKDISAKAGLHFNASLNGLAELLLLRDEKDFKAAFETFSHETEMGRRWLWSRIVWANMIDSDFYKSLETDAASNLFVRRRYVLDFISGLFCAYAEKSGSDRKINDVTVLGMIEAVRQANLSDEEFARLFEADGTTTKKLEKPDLWLDPNGFGKLLRRALKAGRPYALQAAMVLSGKPNQYSKTIDSILAVLAERAIHDETAMNALILILSRTGKYEALVHAVETLSLPIPPIVEQYAGTIDKMRIELITSESSKERGLGYRLWFHFIQSNIVALPKIGEIVAKMDRERDPGIPNSKWVAALTGLCAEKGGCEISRAIDILKPWAGQSRDAGLREEANYRIAILAARDEPSNCVNYFAEIIETAMSVPTHGGRIASLGWVVEKLIPGHFKFAMENVKRILIGIKSLNFHAQAIKGIKAKWIKMMRKLFQAAGFDDKKELLELAPQLDEELARLIIEVASRESFAEMSPILEKFLDDPRLSDRVKEKIRREKYFRERTSGNEGWPELYDLFLPNESGVPENARE